MVSARVLAGRVRIEGERRLGEVVGATTRRLGRVSNPAGHQTLFVAAHARSGSTMLTHILGHHPKILSVGEHHVSYRGSADLQRLRDRTAFMARDLRSEPDFVVEKIVHNTHTISDDILLDPSTRYLFLLRRPEGTLPSVGKLFGHSDLERQLTYYRRRLDGMVEIARTIADPSRAALVTYEQLTTDSEAALAFLTTFLGVTPDLSADYGVGTTTGRQAWGDPSERIRSGTIDRGRTEPEPLPASISEEASTVYDNAFRRLASLVTTDPGLQVP